MSDKTKKAGNFKIYLGTFIFSVLWGLFCILNLTRGLNYSWDNFVSKFPERLDTVYSIFSGSDSGKSPYAFLFGRYINKPGNPKITITAIDDYTVKKYGYPFKHRYYAILAEKLKAMGVKAIGMDVTLFNPDKDEPSNDRRFAEAVAKTGIVVNLVAVNPDTWEITKPIAPLESVSALLAHPHVELTQDTDGQIRRYEPFYPGKDTKGNGVTDNFLTFEKAGLTKVRCWKDCKDASLPSLGIAPYAVYSGESLLSLEMKYSGEKYLNYRYPVLYKEHPAWDKDIKNRSYQAYRNISAADILEDRLSAQEKAAFKDGITYVGSTALAAYDHVPSVFYQQMPGVYVHATFLDNLMAGDFRTELDEISQTLLFLLLPWVPVLMRRYSLGSLLAVSVSVMALLAGSYIVLLSHNIVMPFMSMFLSIFMPFAYVTVDKGLSEGREKKWIKNTFGQYLSPKVVEIITKDPSKLSLGGEKRDMTAMFCDIAGFTTISERLTPEQLTAMLNTYLSGLTDVILKHDGVVDKFMGDCIMSFWNAPLELKNHRASALFAAVECVAVNDRLNAESKDKTLQPVFRVGLNAGPMTVGNMGSRNRFSYTAIGDSVNLASRLEGANKFFHSRIMASEYVFDEAKDLLDARYLGQIRVVGKAIPVKVYEPFARKGEALPEVAKMLPLYAAGIANFYAGKYAESARDFKAALEARPKDGPSQFYMELAEKYAKEPPKNWDGAFNLDSK